MADKIKMFIDNEEVVSNHEFSIREEMLSASSTILNNCYPKAWETVKDYTSNFYYPKDYSKFLLGKGEFLHGNTEYSPLEISGTPPLQFNTNVSKELNAFKIYGDTTQKTRSGKNLLNINTFEKGRINNSTGQIEYASNTTSMIIGGHDITFTVSMAWNSGISSDFIPVQQGDYTYSGTSDKRVYYYVDAYNSSKSYVGRIFSANQTGEGSRTFTVESGVAYIRLHYEVNAVDTYTVSYLQIEKGSSATSYEPYGVMPSPEFPSKLVSIGYENLYNEMPLTKGLWINGNVIAPNSSGWYIVISIEGGKTYTISKKNTNGMIRALTTEIYPANNVPVIDGFGGGVNLTEWTIKTSSNANYLFIGLYAGSSITDEEKKLVMEDLQITVSSRKHSYIPVGKYAIEITNTGKNLFNVNSALQDTYVCPCKVGDKFTLSFKGYGTSTDKRIFLRTYDGVFNSSLDSFNDQVLITITDTEASYTATITSTVDGFVYIRTAAGYNNYVLSNIQVEHGEEATSYEEYKSNMQLYLLDEPLRAIGNVKDELYLQNGVIYIERNIGYKQILSSMSMSAQNILTFSKEMRVSLTDIGNIQTTSTSPSNLLSNGFVGQSTWNNDKVGIMGYAGNPVNSIAFRIPVSDDNTFFDNHTIFLQYILQTPKIETLGKLEIPNVYEGENNLSLYVGDLQATIDVYYYWKNCDVLFAGIVKNSGDISLNPRYPHYCSLQILDYKTFLSESNTLDFVIAGKTIEQAIEMVVEAISGYGFVVGEIDIAEADDVIGAYSTLNKTAYDVFQYLAEISGSRWRARYIDSLTMAIDFYDPNTLPQADDIEYTKQYWEDNNIVDLTFSYGTRDYRNKQILLSDEVYATINYDEVLIANGYTNNYTLQNNIASVVKILINDDEKTVATINEKQMGIDADFYYTPGKNILESNNIYSAGTIIHLTYQPLVKGRQIVYNNDEVDRISQQTDTVGVIARYETRNDVLSSDELEKIAQTYIEYKGKPEIVLTLTTQNKDLFNIGEVVYFNAPIEELAQNYMIKSKETQYIIETENGGINLFYVYEMTSSFNSEKAINYFDNQRNKASGNISQGENITRNIDIETQAKIIWSEGTVSSTTVTVVGDNVLNSALNSPLVE